MKRRSSGALGSKVVSRCLLGVTLALAFVPAASRAQRAGTQEAGGRAPGDAQAARSAPAYAELPNFHKVDEHLYRGAQPHKGGLERLAAMGVRSVVNLRDDDVRAREEERDARALGLRYFNVPISRAGRPSEERIKELLEIVDAPANQPAFVHCKRGADRTGAFVAVYRMTHDGWTGERALEEAEAYGMRFWQRGKKDFIMDYYRDHFAHVPADATKK